MRRLASIILLLTLPAAAQDWFEYRAEPHSCWLPKPAVTVLRWKLSGEEYRCDQSPVVVSRGQLQAYLQKLQEAHDWPECEQEAVQAAKDKVQSVFGVRDDVLDLAERISPDSIRQSYRNSLLSFSTGWTGRELTFEGKPFRVESRLDMAENPRTHISRDNGKFDTVCSFETQDFIRILTGDKPEAEVDYYIGQDDTRDGRDYWSALAQLQEQPNFQEWQAIFRLQQAFECHLESLASGQGDWRLWFVPRKNRGISRVYWNISSYKPGEQPLPLVATLEYYRSCEQRLAGVKWLQKWLSGANGRSVELDIVDHQARPDAIAWKAAGLPGEPGFQLQLRNREGHTRVLLGEAGGAGLVTECFMKDDVPWSGHGKLEYGQTLLVNAEGQGSLCPK